MPLLLYFRTIVLLTALLPFAAGAQNAPGASTIPGSHAEAGALGSFLQQAGILGPQFTFSPADVGFDIDTADPRMICCDVVFMEVLRRHLTADQVAATMPLAARRMPLVLDSTAAQQALLYTPFTAGSLHFVLVESPSPGSRSASLVVLKNEGGAFSILETSPLCRARRSAVDACRK